MKKGAKSARPMRNILLHLAALEFMSSLRMRTGELRATLCSELSQRLIEQPRLL
jgi:hypothetical protein